MKIIKLEHSGIIVEKNGRKVVCDPVEFELELPTLAEVDALVITHKHSDHLQLDAISRILEANPEVQVFAPEDAIENIPQAQIAQAGDAASVGEFRLRFFGENHAAIVPGEVPCQNIGVVIDEKVVNPGDSFDLPDNLERPEVLLVPSAAPWCKVSEGMEYIRRAQPRRVIPVHNAVLSELGNTINNNWLKLAADEVEAEFYGLGVGEELDF